MPKAILMAEDNANDVELALAALDEYHLANTATVVRDGAAALDYVYRRGVFAERPAEHPLLILLDLKMPKVSGLEVLKQIKGDPTLHSIPVVILTSSREEQDVTGGYHLGANAYVVKPIEFNKFVEAVKTLGLFWAVVNEPPPTPREKS